MRNSGSPLAEMIIKNIDNAQIFACDLTYPNHNVSFEIGYAIGRYKRIFASLDTTIENSERRFKRHYFNLLGLSYSSYENHVELSEQFLRERPWSDLDSTILHDRHRRMAPRPEFPTLLYVQPKLVTPAVLETHDMLSDSMFRESLIVDDPNENPSPSSDWYADQVRKADVVLVHLLSSEHREAELHNIKASLIAGLASALRRPLLMLAHSPFDSACRLWPFATNA